ncbi:hypothetical protein ACFU8R_07125 [Pseudonocardia alni]|jgi:hypothetical protein|uniref:Membrane protein implicated in regulation of membrane protease activity n=1 Tax=Pseudonocardia alni TaxID=33907 RepID=A0A852W643_PSEA5|nr:MULTISPECIES: hypothetical protein [Pseudonocardia]MCO7193174.1 hypothetical protein [Pseudonocardia sp. McavD-2-B]MYW74167.1 hypothetical protein [Pseudonocardia sp. SID8383]NYG02244.1 membrane protein implicated in regulation of membrane protease activity [Pseudonocardia antarctica]OJG04196.1 hypothetical protein BG618_04605 [Pseudonocardia autotrophica]
MALLRRLFLIPDGVPAPLRGAVAALIVLVAVLWPLTLLPAGTSTAVLVVVSVLSVLALFALAAALLRRRYPGAHR